MDLTFLYGVLNLSFWEYALVTFLMVQTTVTAVTLYLHRDATHRSLDLHPVMRHFFRFWIWMSSGMLTNEWVAVHRKHHAFSDEPGDPHSPVVFGCARCSSRARSSTRRRPASAETLEKYGRGTPDDWIERNVYSRYWNVGIILMVLIDLVLFGVPGIIILCHPDDGDAVFRGGRHQRCRPSQRLSQLRMPKMRPATSRRGVCCSAAKSCTTITTLSCLRQVFGAQLGIRHRLVFHPPAGILRACEGDSHGAGACPGRAATRSIWIRCAQSSSIACTYCVNTAAR